MTEVKIGGKNYKMTVNIGTLTFAEAINDGVPKTHELRYWLGFILACLHGADLNCAVTLDDLMKHCTKRKKFVELKEAAEKELAAFNSENDDMADGNEESAKDEDPESGN